MAAVPIIDITGLNGSPEERKAVAAKINAACEDIGFLCITGHGIDPALVEKVRSVAMTFFNKPEAVKREIQRQPPGMRGYVPFASVSLGRGAGRANASRI
jgi:isopenicillin N synthase-like dioxygenase